MNRERTPLRTACNWLDRTEYPFVSRFFDTARGRLHYVDEGVGEVVLFIHGNPTWSFEHRKLVAHLSKRYRCVAVDHLGFGLSDKPQEASYLPQFHAENLASFIEELGLKDITLVVHDWGGPIGISYALRCPMNVKRIVVYNSWFWSVKSDKTFERFSGFVGGPIGRFLCRRFNFFPRVLMPKSVGDRSKLPKSLVRQFTSPFPTPESRKGTWVFPRAIIGESEWLESLWKKRQLLKEIPFLFLWGLNDVAFTKNILARWEGTFPNHKTILFPTVGHFAPEEIGEDAFMEVEAFLKRNP